MGDHLLGLLSDPSVPVEQRVRSVAAVSVIAGVLLGGERLRRGAGRRVGGGIYTLRQLDGLLYRRYRPESDAAESPPGA